MARIIPNDLTPLALTGGHRHELATLELLRRALPDDYTVFHGVHWSRGYQRYSAFGEIDFVVVNRSGDVVVIEQKSGALQESESALVKDYGDRQTNVAEQLHRSLDAIRAKWQFQHPREPALTLDYLIYCPDHRLGRFSSTALERSRIVDAAARDGLAARLRELLGPGAASQRDRQERVLGFFTQTFELVPDVHAYRSAQERSYTRLSGGLLRLVDSLEMQPFRLRVCGAAGSGKSQLARHYFDRTLAAGKRPLLICFNRPLKDSLEAAVQPGGLVETWYGLCHRFAESLGHTVDFGAEAYRKPGFWKELEELLLASEIPEQWQFDAVIVDEGQDFDPEWGELLALFQREGADLLWLEDPLQNLRGAGGLPLDGMVTYHARENYRTPYSIARFILATLPQQFIAANDVPGLGVGVRAWESVEEQVELAERAVRELLQRGFAPEDIVILTCRGVHGSVLSSATELAGLPLRRFTGQYDAAGRQVLTDGRLSFDSVYRYKGQQAPAVVLVDVDPRPAQHEHDLRVLFVGMTRATVRLELLVNAANPYSEHFLRAL